MDYNPKYDSEYRNKIIELWIENSNNLLTSTNLESDIRTLLLKIINEIGFKINDKLLINLDEIIIKISKDISILNESISSLQKFKNSKVESIIKILNSLQKKSIEFLIKSFINNYLDQIIKLLNEQIDVINNILDGGNYNHIKYLKYEIYYLINKLNLL